MIRKKLLVKNLTGLLMIVFLNPVGLAWSESTDTDELRAQQQKLRELLDRIGEAQELRGEQHATLRKLEKQMSCNWGLIQDYDICEQKYKDKLEAHVSCKQEAKKKAVECLSSSSE